MRADKLPDNHVLIELRRPSAFFTSDPSEMDTLHERKAELLSQRIKHWLGRVTPLFASST
jgi:hypothetical protein